MCRTDRREAEMDGLRLLTLPHVSQDAAGDKLGVSKKDSIHSPLPLPYYTPLSTPVKNWGRVLDSRRAGVALVNSRGTHPGREAQKTGNA